MRYVICALLLSLVALPTPADILNVPSDFPTIQAAMDAAQDGDEIVLAPGTYNVDSPLNTITTNPFRVLEAFTIRSTDPSDSATVAATRIHAASMFSLFEGVDQLELAGITLSGDGCDEFAGSINDGLTIRSCVIEGGDANDQFAIESLSGSLRLIDTQFMGQVGRIVGDVVPPFEIDGCTFGPRTGTYDFFPLSTLDEVHLSNMSFIDIDASDGGQVLWPDAHTVVMTNMTFIRTPSSVPTARSIEIYGSRFEDIDRTGSTSNYLFNDPSDPWSFVAEDSQFVDLSGGLFEDGLGVVQADTVSMRRCLVQRCGGLFGTVHGTDTGQVFEDCDFLENSADAGAALELHGEITIDRCRFIGNRPAEDPVFETTCTIFLSGVINRYDDPIVIRDCEFRDNGGPEAPAGWSELECFFNGNYSRGGSLTVERSRFVGNRGGVLLSPRNAPDNMPFAAFADCEIVGNGRPNVGFGNTVFRHCTFANNGNEPGSLWQFSGTAGEVTNCIVDHEFDDGQGSPLFRETVTVSRSVLPAAVPGASNSTTLNPLFIRPPSDGGDGWGDDPATPDIDESLNDDLGDPRLQPGSPAIDAGTNDFYTPGDLDLDGNPRLADDPGIPGANVDIGAYEFQGTTCLPDVNQDGLATPADYNAWILAYNNRSPLADQNRDGAVTPADYNAWILNYNTGCP